MDNREENKDVQKQYQNHEESHGYSFEKDYNEIMQGAPNYSAFQPLKSVGDFFEQFSLYDNAPQSISSTNSSVTYNPFNA